MGVRQAIITVGRQRNESAGGAINALHTSSMPSAHADDTRPAETLGTREQVKSVARDRDVHPTTRSIVDMCQQGGVPHYRHDTAAAPIYMCDYSHDYRALLLFPPPCSSEYRYASTKPSSKALRSRLISHLTQRQVMNAQTPIQENKMPKISPNA